MDDLDSVLLPGHRSGEKPDSPSVPAIAALFGVAGLGKTQVASQYVYTRSPQFEAVFWICAEDIDKLEADFCNIATRIGLVSEKEPHNPSSTKELVHSWLSKPTWTVGGKSDIDQGSPPKWLLVFDNADRPEVLEDYVDIEGPGSILVTSRDPQVCNVSSHIVAVDLPPFTEEEALGFFKKSSRQSFKTEKDYDDCRGISRQLDGLPLALGQVAGVAKEQILTISNVREMLTDKSDRNRLFDVPSSRYQRGSLSSIFAFTELDTNSQFMAQVVSCFHPDHIEESIFRHIDQSRTIVRLPLERTEYFKARATLLRASIIRQNDQGEKEQWSMHRVPQQVIRDRLSTDPKRQLETFSNAVKLIKLTWPTVSFEKRHTKRSGTVTREMLHDHVVSLGAMYEKEILPHGKPSENTEFEFATILQEAAWYVRFGDLT